MGVGVIVQANESFYKYTEGFLLAKRRPSDREVEAAGCLSQGREVGGCGAEWEEKSFQTSYGDFSVKTEVIAGKLRSVISVIIF